MSRPRKPYGPNPPGRLMGTMIKVLAAELSDQGRLSRGKRYWADDAVVDIVVGHGAVTAEIQGSRQQPYVVTIEATGGSGVPSRRDVWVQCTCPDDTGTGVDLCKHAVAAMFTLADEVSIDPELVDRWRSGRRSNVARQHEDRADADVPAPPDPSGTAGGDDGTVTSLADRVDRDQDDDDDDGDDDDGDDDDQDDDDDEDVGADVVELHPHRMPDADVISALLGAPAGTAPPTFPEPAHLDHGAAGGGLLADTLADALDHLAIRWE